MSFIHMSSTDSCTLCGTCPTSLSRCRHEGRHLGLEKRFLFLFTFVVGSLLPSLLSTMASPLEGVMPWHDGENIMHKILSIPNSNNPTSLFLFPAAGYFLQTAPLLALGTLDDKGRPWTTLWGGERGFAKPLGSSIIGVKAVVDQKNDPLFGALFHRTAGEATKKHNEGKMISGLAFDLESRQRIKLYGKMVAGTLGAMNGRKDKDRASTSICRIELLLKIEQSLGD